MLDILHLSGQRKIKPESTRIQFFGFEQGDQTSRSFFFKEVSGEKSQTVFTGNFLMTVDELNYSVYVVIDINAQFGENVHSVRLFKNIIHACKQKQQCFLQPVLTYFHQQFLTLKCFWGFPRHANILHLFLMTIDAVQHYAGLQSLGEPHIKGHHSHCRHPRVIATLFFLADRRNVFCFNKIRY